MARSRPDPAGPAAGGAHDRGPTAEVPPVGSSHLCTACGTVHGFGTCPTARRLTDETLKRRGGRFVWW